MDISEGSTIGGSVARASGAFLAFSGFPIKPLDRLCRLCYVVLSDRFQTLLTAF